MISASCIQLPQPAEEAFASLMKPTVLINVPTSSSCCSGTFLQVFSPKVGLRLTGISPSVVAAFELSKAPTCPPCHPAHKNSCCFMFETGPYLPLPSKYSVTGMCHQYIWSMPRKLHLSVLFFLWQGLKLYC